MSPSPRLCTALLLLVTTAEAAVTLVDSTPLASALSFLAAAGVLLRTRVPGVAVVLTLPGLLFGCATIAAVVAVYALASKRGASAALATAVAGVFAAGLIGQLTGPYPLHPVALVTTAAMFAIAPAAVGILGATRRRLVQSLTELRAVHEEQRAEAAAAAVRSEREALAREMHDVVSHQVSLMAVQAGALQVSVPDPAAREGARTIRELCVATLEELRSMLLVLRVGERAPIVPAPQPSLADLPALIAASDLPVSVDLDLPDTLAIPAQRAVFRTVQESLTNARKHAPGSSITVTAQHADEKMELRIRNTPPRAAALALPGSGLGLLGLTERAQVLGGTVAAGATPEGGYETVLRLPLHGVADARRPA